MRPRRSAHRASRPSTRRSRRRGHSEPSRTSRAAWAPTSPSWSRDSPACSRSRPRCSSSSRCTSSRRTPFPGSLEREAPRHRPAAGRRSRILDRRLPAGRRRDAARVDALVPPNGTGARMRNGRHRGSLRGHGRRRRRWFSLTPRRPTGPRCAARARMRRRVLSRRPLGAVEQPQARRSDTLEVVRLVVPRLARGTTT